MIQPAMKHTPPAGVTGQIQDTFVKESRYKLPLKKRIPVEKSIAAHLNCL
jgi:hypothetical protein